MAAPFLPQLWFPGFWGKDAMAAAVALLPGPWCYRVLPMKQHKTGGNNPVFQRFSGDLQIGNKVEQMLHSALCRTAFTARADRVRGLFLSAE